MSTEERFTEEEFTKIEDLNPRSRGVNTIVRVVSKSPVREVTSRRDQSMHMVCDALVGDETASVILTLWDDTIDEIGEGDTITIKNGYCSLFRGSMRLNIGRYGSFEKTEPAITDVNTENNLSDKVYEQPRRYPTFRSMYSDRGYRRGGRRRRY
ncbi:MAG: hypothetical protein ACE5Z5_07270 [Candidatus Bathyarchaeia archaeon]